MFKTVINDFFAFFNGCSSCFCHIDLLFRIIIHKFSIGIRTLYPASEYLSGFVSECCNSINPYFETLCLKVLLKCYTKVVTGVANEI